MRDDGPGCIAADVDGFGFEVAHATAPEVDVAVVHKAIAPAD